MLLPPHNKYTVGDMLMLIIHYMCSLETLCISCFVDDIFHCGSNGSMLLLHKHYCSIMHLPFPCLGSVAICHFCNNLALLTISRNRNKIFWQFDLRIIHIF